MTLVQTATFSITHVDVLYVVQQIKRDLVALSEAYPQLLPMQRVLDLHDAMITFLANDAVARIGFSVVDPPQADLVYHELRYDISYTGTGGRVGIGGAAVRKVRVPNSAKVMPWVVWSSTMLALGNGQQRHIVQGTGWSAPGAATQKFRPRYIGGTFTERSRYSSGSLAAQSQEYRQGAV